MTALPALLLLGAVLVAVSRGETAPDSKYRLKQDLLRHYDRTIEPGIGQLATGLMVNCIRFDDEHPRLAVIDTFDTNTWRDPKLQWDPQAYGGLESIRIPGNQIWTPDTRNYHQMGSVERDSELNAVVTSDGTVLWIPISTYRVYCDQISDSSDMTCKMRIGSWTFDGNQVALKPFADKDPIDLSNYLEFCPWSVTAHSARVVEHKYECCDEPYPSLDVSFTVHKK
jgi:hypothetical protein